MLNQIFFITIKMTSHKPNSAKPINITHVDFFKYILHSQEFIVDKGVYFFVNKTQTFSHGKNSS
jgi:hypothetical protein